MPGLIPYSSVKPVAYADRLISVNPPGRCTPVTPVATGRPKKAIFLNPKLARAASHCQRINMKRLSLICISSIALALSGFGQTVTPDPTTPQVSASAAVSASTDDDEDSIESAVKKDLKHKFGKLGITIDTDRGHTHVSRHHKDSDSNDDEDLGALMAIPIVGIIFSTLFGAPVLVVAAIMFFSYMKQRSLHRTVRMMVEKGQEVPAGLFATPPVIRARSDLRRGVVLLMVGLGLMIFFGAVNDWENGVWSLGVIPGVIGLGYLLVWKLETRRDKVPPLP